MAVAVPQVLLQVVTSERKVRSGCFELLSTSTFNEELPGERSRSIHLLVGEIWPEQYPTYPKWHQMTNVQKQLWLKTKGREIDCSLYELQFIYLYHKGSKAEVCCPQYSLLMRYEENNFSQCPLLAHFASSPPTRTNRWVVHKLRSSGQVSRQNPHLHSISYQEEVWLVSYEPWLLRYGQNGSRNQFQKGPKFCTLF